MSAEWDCRSVCDPLTDGQRVQLEALLVCRTRASAEERLQFLNATGAWIEVAQGMAERRPLSATRDSLERLSAACRRLQVRLNDVDGEIDMRIGPWFDAMCLLTEAPVEIPDRLRREKPELAEFLIRLREDLSTLRALADYAASKMEPAGTSKPGMFNSRFLVKRLAESYRGITGSPVTVSKGTWFPDYAAEACRMAGFNALDPDTVRRVVLD